MEQVTVWRCSDGATFESPDEAQAYEAQLDARSQVDGFIMSREWTRGQATLARNLIGEFLTWREGWG